MKDLTLVIKFLSELGLDVERSQIYLSLLQKGAMTVLELSRATKISRTTMYRLVEELQRIGLVEEQINGERKVIYPVGVHKLELLVKEQENKTESLKKLLPEISSYLATDISLSQPGTKVMMYKGVEGIKQMVWNVLKAETECVGYSYRELSEIVGVDFARKWKMEFVLRKLKLRDLVNEDYAEEHTGQTIYNESLSFSTKVITKDVLEINHQIDIYNDVVAYYKWHSEEIFGIEIYNSDISKLQRQLFNIVWKMGKNV